VATLVASQETRPCPLRVVYGTQELVGHYGAGIENLHTTYCVEVEYSIIRFIMHSIPSSFAPFFLGVEGWNGENYKGEGVDRVDEVR
jgi:hypothetical protein